MGPAGEDGGPVDSVRSGPGRGLATALPDVPGAPSAPRVVDLLVDPPNTAGLKILLAGKSEPAAEPTAKAEAVAVPEPGDQTGPAVEPEVKTELTTEPGPKTEVEPETETEPGPETEPNVGPDVAVVVETEPDAEPKAEVHAEPDTDVDAEPKAEPETRAESVAEIEPAARTVLDPEEPTEPTEPEEPEEPTEPTAGSIASATWLELFSSKIRFRTRNPGRTARPTARRTQAQQAQRRTRRPARPGAAHPRPGAAGVSGTWPSCCGRRS